MTIRRASMTEIDQIMEIYDSARTYMREQNNPTQWGNGYPSRELIARDIESGACHVCEEADEILGVFYYAEGEDPTYGYIEGEWLNALLFFL